MNSSVEDEIRSRAALSIREVKARAVLAPLPSPIRTAVGTIPSAPLVLIDVMTEEGVRGCAYIFGYVPATLRPLVRLIEDIAPDRALAGFFFSSVRSPDST